jgi:hypothetical protein
MYKDHIYLDSALHLAHTSTIVEHNYRTLHVRKPNTVPYYCMKVSFSILAPVLRDPCWCVLLISEFSLLQVMQWLTCTFISKRLENRGPTRCWNIIKNIIEYSGIKSTKIAQIHLCNSGLWHKFRFGKHVVLYGCGTWSHIARQQLAVWEQGAEENVWM